MIIYAPEPLDILSLGERPDIIDIKLSTGGIIQAIPWGVNQVKIVNLVSTDPLDFINSQYLPGRIITMNTGLDI